MAEVRITVDRREYRLACDEGEQDRIAALAVALDERVGQLAAGGNPAGASQILVMAALMLASDLDDTRAELEAERARAAAVGELTDERARAAKDVEAAAGRIEELSGLLGAAAAADRP